MTRKLEHTEAPFLELLEEAVHLLRLAPLGTLLVYAAATLPFVTGLLFYWSDMTHSPFARERCAQGAWVLCLLYAWMRCGQAVFCSRLRAQLRQESPPAWRPSRLAGLLVVQLAAGPLGLAGLAVSLLAMLPFGWVYAWHQNCVAMYDEQDLTLRAAFHRAWRMALLWPHQNHYAMCTLLMFNMFVFGNTVAVLGYLPFLVRMLFGVESEFTQSMHWMFNTTFLAVAGGLAHLCVDPIIKATYVVRCHQGDSIRTGQDLLAALKPLRSTSRATALAILLVLLCAARAGADTPATATPATAPSPVQVRTLDESIDRVMNRRDYTWRLPRDLLPETGATEKNIIERFAESLASWSKRTLDAVGRAIEKFIKWLEKKFGFKDWFRPSNDGESANWAGTLRWLTWTLLGATACIMAVLLWKAWRQRHALRAAEVVDVVQPVPDLDDENVLASHLPDDEWMALAEQLRRQGELRKALRAYFLAGLAWLGSRELVEIRLSKSNHDYTRELERRARRFPGAMPFFGNSVSLFERSWYGLHPVTDSELDQLTSNLRNLKDHVAP